LLSPIFCSTPVSRDIDCYSLVKISEILADAQYFVDANIFDIFCMAGQYNKPVQCGRESAHSRAASGNGTLGDCMWRDNIFWETWENISEVWEKSAAVDSARPNSKEILLHLRQHFVHSRILSTRVFCRREYFVDSSILSTRVFCRSENFVNTSILSTPTFCQREYFVDTNIFCRRKHFCWCQYFVVANILSAPIFCRRQYILLPPIFCHGQ
jgi:hypothetical protein